MARVHAFFSFSQIKEQIRAVIGPWPDYCTVQRSDRVYWAGRVSSLCTVRLFATTRAYDFCSLALTRKNLKLPYIPGRRLLAFAIGLYDDRSFATTERLTASPQDTPELPSEKNTPRCEDNEAVL